MKISPRFALAVGVMSLSLLTACNRGAEGDGTTTTGTAENTSSTSSAGPTTFLGVLGNSAVIVASGSNVSVQGVAGEEMWKFQLPEGDTVVAQPAGALSSVAYVRGQKNVYAIAPDGKLLWKYAHVDQNANIKSIIALGDSTGAMTVGDTSIVAFSNEGQPRWTYLLPNGDKITSVPVVAANSFVYVRGQKTLYCLDSQGGMNWKKDLP